MVKTHFPCTWVYHPDIEGDDSIYYICKKLNGESDITIVSSDTDFIQIINELDNVKLWNPVSKDYRPPTDYDYVQWKAMVGDRSDNIKGVKGIGKVKAEKILKEGILSEKLKDLNFKDAFDHSYKMIKLDDELKEFGEIKIIESCLNSEGLLSLFSAMNFKSLTGEESFEKFKQDFSLQAN